VTSHVFVGPTLSTRDVLAVVPDAVIHPPVAHGDLLRLDPRPDDRVLIIDGCYHHVGSVRHKEILCLLAAGVRVIGCSSMGALRAAELYPFGMVGNGVVFDMYRGGVIDSDDEVAVAHGEAPDYRMFGDALVNIRHGVAVAERAEVVTAAESTTILDRALGIPYTTRSWRALAHEATGAHPGAAVTRVRAYLAGRPEHRDVKAADAVETLGLLDILADAGSARLDWATSGDWKNRYLYEWLAACRGDAVAGVHVDHGAVVRHRQIYDPGFPARWRRFALEQISRSVEFAAAGDDLEAAALAAAARRGISAELLTAAQMRHWLRHDELRDVRGREAVLRILTRSYLPPRRTYDLIVALPDLVRDASTRAAVAECYAINAEVATWKAGRSTDHIRATLLRKHLADVWDVDNDDTEWLCAAARDRGLGSLTEAVDAVRPFYLRHYLGAAGAGRDGEG
jgi:hypothetical protein